MDVIVFEDELVSQLDPITVGRPAFSVQCGGKCLLDLVARLGAVKTICRPHLVESFRASHPTIDEPSLPAAGSVVLVNARLVPKVSSIGLIEGMIAAGRPGVVRHGRRVAAALVEAGQGLPRGPADRRAWLDAIESLASDTLEIELPLLEHPHEVLRHHPQALAEFLEERIAQGDCHEVANGVFAAPSVTIGQHVVTDTQAGPIVLEEGASIGPLAFLRGPVYLDHNARVVEHASIKDSVALGHTTKIGGEVETSIIEPYSNKQHDGFLGHSYIGRWVNLGAGTSNSDLKNTYGAVNVDYRGNKVSTGMQFFGCIVGDHAKTAINTGIFTGKIIGVCSMVYGFVTTNVPSFVNYARSLGQITEETVESAAVTQARMFHRRGVTQRPCDVQLLRDMFELTRHERRFPVGPLSL